MPKRRMTPARRRQIAMWSLKGRKVSRNRYRNKSFTAFRSTDVRGNWPVYRSALPVYTGTRANKIARMDWNNPVRISYRSVERSVKLNPSTIDGSRMTQYYLKPRSNVYPVR